MHTVYEAANLIDAQSVPQALQAEGLPAFVHGRALTGCIDAVDDIEGAACPP
ncbi:MAG: hypothetical protein QM612_08550 [Thermomonas sp.]|uniref:hypothetical protein n=1 Tax=Thermomonas sp. TaxID=1971895 RepID=UPI0039E2ABDE